MSYFIAILISASIAFGSAWQIQTWRMEAHEKQTIAAAAYAQQIAYVDQQNRSMAVIASQNDARKRELTLHADADRARSALVGLRSSTDAALRTADSSLATCLVVATTTSELLNTSADQYRELAEKADRHVSDIRALIP